MEATQAEMNMPTFDIKSIIDILASLGLDAKFTPKDFKNPSVNTKALTTHLRLFARLRAVCLRSRWRL